jgi:hypothetical protein
MESEYGVEKAAGTLPLSEQVSAAMKKGWIPHGSLVIEDEGADRRYMQPMVRYFAVRHPKGSMAAVVQEVHDERKRQVVELGHGASADDKLPDLLRDLAECKLVRCDADRRPADSVIARVIQSGRSVEGAGAGTPRQLLIEAAALIIAEIERRDRAKEDPT